MIEIIDKFKYAGLFLLALASIFIFWLIEKDFMFIKDLTVVEYSNKELVKKSIGKYVRINNACTFDISLYKTENDYKKQVFAAIDCKSEKGDSTYLFAQIDNQKLTTIDGKIEKIKTGELFLFEGQLERIQFTNDDSYLFKNAGLKFNENDCLLIISGRKPDTVLTSFYIFTVTVFALAIGMSFVFYYIIDKPRRKKL